MSDRELADKVVALGVGSEANKPGLFWFGSDCIGGAGSFVRDWRVAGDLLEKCYEFAISIDTFCEAHREIPTHGSMARAIIEACVEALDDG